MVVVVVKLSLFPVPEQFEFAVPIISIVAAEDFDIEQFTPGAPIGIIPVPCASNTIVREREFISCGGGVFPSHSVHCTYEWLSPVTETL